LGDLDESRQQFDQIGEVDGTPLECWPVNAREHRHVEAVGDRRVWRVANRRR
jgi:hypothetical protein